MAQVGQLCILDLRKFAEDALGSSFDLKWFHSQVLMDGPMPLKLLEEKVKSAVCEKLKSL